MKWNITQTILIDPVLVHNNINEPLPPLVYVLTITTTTIDTVGAHNIISLSLNIILTKKIEINGGKNHN